MNTCIIIGATMWLHLTDGSYATAYVNVDNITHINDSGRVEIAGRSGASIRPWSETTGMYMTGEEVMDMIRYCE